MFAFVIGRPDFFVAVVVVAGVTVVNAVAVVGIAVVVVVAIIFDVVVRFCVGLTVAGTVMVVESFGEAVTVFGRFSDVVGAGIVAVVSFPDSDKAGDVTCTDTSGSPVTLGRTDSPVKLVIKNSVVPVVFSSGSPVTHGLTDSPVKLVIKNSVVPAVFMLADPSGVGLIGA